MGLQHLDATVLKQEDAQGPDPRKCGAPQHRELILAKVQEPGAVRNPVGDVGEPPGSTVHKVRGAVAQAVMRTQPGCCRHR